jgi:hypothetical protein
MRHGQRRLVVRSPAETLVIARTTIPRICCKACPDEHPTMGGERDIPQTIGLDTTDIPHSRALTAQSTRANDIVPLRNSFCETIARLLSGHSKRFGAVRRHPSASTVGRLIP